MGKVLSTSRGNLMTLAEAVRALGLAGRSYYDGIGLTGVSTDSRNIKPGELFVALKGDVFDGTRFVGKAFEQGAAAAVVATGGRPDGGHFLIEVPDTLTALGEMAAYIRRRRPLTVLAITGSNGKTTSKEMAAAIIGRKYKILSSLGNYNNLIGLPLTLFQLSPDQEIAVLEMGMSVPGEIARLTDIAAPDYGLVTNIGPAHLEGLGSLQAIADAKGELFAGLPASATALVNGDDPLVIDQAERFNGRKLRFGLTGSFEITAVDLKMEPDASTWTLVTPSGRAEIRLNLPGRHNVQNALSASAAAWVLGLGPEDMAAGLNDFQSFPGRLHHHLLPGPIRLWDDTYNANPVSMVAALETLAAQNIGGRRIAVLGDMLELGRESRELHRSIGTAAVENGIDILAAVGAEAKFLAEGARESAGPDMRIHWFAGQAEALEFLAANLKPHDLVLIKGSRGMRMENMVKSLIAGSRN